MKSTTCEFTEEIRTFLQEKLYLQNVSPKTIILYHSCFKAFPSLEPESIKARVVELRERGVSPVTVNTYLRHIKTFYLWKGLPWELPWLKEEQKILATLTSDQISGLLQFGQMGNKGFHSVSGRRVNILRAHLVALTILDCGLRASEVLGLTKESVDFDNLVFKVMGKGGRQRLVPFTSELRKHLWRHQVRQNILMRFTFGTNNNTTVSVRNLERDFKVLGKKLGITGIRFSPHTLRHTFAVSYLKNGGNLEYLRRILGHTSLSTTQKYLRSLGVSDLGAVHSQFSPLSSVSCNRQLAR